MNSNLLKDVADYWRKVKSGALPAPGPNEISITLSSLDGAIARIYEMERDSYTRRAATLAMRDSWREERAELEAKLANREAKPVAWSTVFGDKRAVTVHAETAEVWNSDGLQVQSLFTAPPAPAVPDAVDIFADQVIGTKIKVIRMPAPLSVPHEGIRVYLNADELFIQLEKQGYIVLIEKH
ncbi:hypothetical protein [Serratia liquefaciens]|uniref:hypothetical protein n=1 Tax=Serratia liquefaciens TaxID=614 RepID=UPI003EC5F7E5